MTLFLCSSGFTSAKLADRFVELFSKPRQDISFAVVPNAMNLQQGSKSWFIDEVNRIAEHFSDNIDFVDIEALPQSIWLERLLAADVIYFIGGENEPLFNAMEVSGFQNHVLELLLTKVYVGTSAGAMVTGQRLGKEAFEFMYGPEGTLANQGLTNYLNIFDGCFIPHLDAPDFPGRNKDLVDQVAKRTSQKIYALDEYSALVYSNGKLETLGEVYEPKSA